MGGSILWCICMSSPAKTVCALDFKFAIEREREREGMELPTLQISIKFCSHRTYRMKMDKWIFFFCWNTGCSQSTLTHCSCHIQQCYIGAASRDLAQSGGRATLGLYWNSGGAGTVVGGDIIFVCTTVKQDGCFDIILGHLSFINLFTKQTLNFVYFPYA